MEKKIHYAIPILISLIDDVDRTTIAQNDRQPKRGSDARIKKKFVSNERCASNYKLHFNSFITIFIV